MNIVTIMVLFIALLFFSVHNAQKKNNALLNNIETAEIIDRIQWTKEQYQHSGVSVGWGGRPRFHYRVKNVPHHVEIKFLVTYKDGHVKTISAIEGTQKCNSLLCYVGAKKQRYPTEQKNNIFERKTNNPLQELAGNRDENMKKETTSFELQKNQIPNGRYVIGKDIPVGTYDFEAIHGSGIMVKYLSETTNENNYFERVGLKDYDNLHLINVDCRDGEVLSIPNNVVVEIKRSKTVIIDL